MACSRATLSTATLCCSTVHSIASIQQSPKKCHHWEKPSTLLTVPACGAWILHVPHDADSAHLYVSKSGWCRQHGADMLSGSSSAPIPFTMLPCSALMLELTTLVQLVSMHSCEDATTMLSGSSSACAAHVHAAFAAAHTA